MNSYSILPENVKGNILEIAVDNVKIDLKEGWLLNDGWICLPLYNDQWGHAVA
jgi:hypothetical protein